MRPAAAAGKDPIVVGLLSDTHLLNGSRLVPHLRDAFGPVDLILHAGDIYHPSVLDDLEEIAPVLAARGDEELPGAPDPRIRQEHLLALGNLTVWLGHEIPIGLLQALAGLQVGVPESSGPETGLVDLVHSCCTTVPDVLVFGDTHRALVQTAGEVLFINPGSPTIPDHLRGPGTVALLTIASGRAEGRIIPLPCDVDRAPSQRG